MEQGYSFAEENHIIISEPEEPTPTVLTIGVGGLKIERFWSIMLLYGIKQIIDVRATRVAYGSEWDYNPKDMPEECKRRGIRYRYIGRNDKIAGYPREEEFYVEGRASYERISLTDQYERSIQEILCSIKTCRTLILGSMTQPQNDPRGLLIGKTLKERGVLILHLIDTDSTVYAIDQHELEDILVNIHFPDRNQLNFIEEPLCYRDMINRGYVLQGKKHAFPYRPGRNRKQKACQNEIISGDFYEEAW